MFFHEDIGFRRVEEDDLEDVRRLRNDPTTWMQLTTVGQISEAQQQRWFERIKDASDCEYYSIFKVERQFPIIIENEFIGIIRFDQIDHANRSVRVGCDITPAERGKGYGTKVYRAMLDYCFRQANFHKLWLLVLEDNEVGRRLYKNVGFVEEGRMRGHVWRDGRWKDYVVMSILEEEYRK